MTITAADLESVAREYATVALRGVDLGHTAMARCFAKLAARAYRRAQRKRLRASR